MTDTKCPMIADLPIDEWCDYWQRSKELLAEDLLAFNTDSEKLMLADLRCAAEAIRELTQQLTTLTAERDGLRGELAECKAKLAEQERYIAAVTSAGRV